MTARKLSSLAQLWTTRVDLVSFNLVLAVQSCSDIASHIIADEGWPAAQTSRVASIAYAMKA
jgi:uncharacterized protein YutE (UPF0331/DUF86 family)